METDAGLQLLSRGPSRMAFTSERMPRPERLPLARRTPVARLPMVAAVLIPIIALPTVLSITIGPLRLSPMRVALILLFVPAVLTLVGGRAGRLRAVDFLVFGFSAWAFVSLSVVHGVSRAIESGGILMIETFAAYLVGRAYVRSPGELRRLIPVLFVVVLVVSVMAIPEFATGRNLIYGASKQNQRYGFSRSAATFDHPILYGAFCISALGLVWYSLPRRRSVLRTLAGGYVVFAALLSISSSAVSAAAFQMMMIAYESTTRRLRGRWLMAAGALAIMLCLLSAASNRPLMRVALNHLTLNSATGYYRLHIWTHGTQNVIDNPLFGIGQNDWVRPPWMYSPSVDAFWLALAMTYGLPGFACLAGGTVLLLWQVKNAPIDPRFRRLRRGWLLSVSSLILLSFTVHFWNALLVWFFMLLGMGVCLCQPLRGRAVQRFVTPNEVKHDTSH